MLFAVYREEQEKRWSVTHLILLPTHSDLVRDVTDTDCWAQQLEMAALTVVLSNFDFNNQDEKSSEKLPQ